MHVLVINDLLIKVKIIVHIQYIFHADESFNSSSSL